MMVPRRSEALVSAMLGGALVPRADRGSFLIAQVAQVALPRRPKVCAGIGGVSEWE